MENLTEQLFLAFARFPAHTGVMKLFNKGASDYANYATLKAAAENLTEKDLVPGITGYVFGVDEATAVKVINTISGFYLLVDYGQINASRDRFEIETNSFYISVTVAHPVSAESMDLPEETVIADMALNYLREIRNYMKTEDRDQRIKGVTFPHQAIPFRAPELNNSIGWTMILTRQSAGEL